MQSVARFCRAAAHGKAPLFPKVDVTPPLSRDRAIG
jgi:hypothetical protein